MTSAVLLACDVAHLAIAHAISRYAVRSLHAELVLYPKPGLVSLHDNGAHTDMDATTFVRSVFALRRYFRDVAIAGMRAATMSDLRRLGVSAESTMLRATNGINTHRGAIFAVGLLSAAAGRAWVEHRSFDDATLRSMIGRYWRRDLTVVPILDTHSLSHGLHAMARFGVSGARGEAMEGFPSVFEIALPALRSALAQPVDGTRAQVHALFMLLANVVDTNVLHRGGSEALHRLQSSARQFIADGSVFATDWLQRAEALHRQCSRERISPGGCADLLAAACFVHRLQT